MSKRKLPVIDPLGIINNATDGEAFDIIAQKLDQIYADVRSDFDLPPKPAPFPWELLTDAGVINPFYGQRDMMREQTRIFGQKLPEIIDWDTFMRLEPGGKEIRRIFLELKPK